MLATWPVFPRHSWRHSGLHENAVRLFVRGRQRPGRQSSERLNSSRSLACIFNEPVLCSEACTVGQGEADIVTGAKRDFASLLDDLFVGSDKGDGVEGDGTGARPSIPFDYLSVADELHSGRIKVSATEYREAGGDLATEFAALLDHAKLALSGEELKPAEKLPPIDPESIAVELGLNQPKQVADLGRMRRSFAFANHPDRVAPHLRQRAAIRMQVANMLIDEAKRRAVAGARR
jgi:hypothetical protein